MKKFVVRLAVVLVIIFGLGFLVLAVSANQAGLSIPAQLVRTVLLPIVPMPSASSPDELIVLVNESRMRGPAQPTDSFRAKFQVQEEDFNGYSVWTAVPPGGSPLHILYIPGGAYVNEVLSLHWDIAEQLIDRTNATLVMPLYPLAPENDWQPAFQFIQAVYERMVQEAGAENVVIAGDSAGGGIALSLTQQLRDQEDQLPAALVLFSPWLDVTLSDPRQVMLDQTDVILSMTSLRIGGEWWAGNLTTTDARISPLFGSMEGLPPIAVFTGTEDLLYPDAVRLAAIAQEQGIPFTLFEYRNQFHVWVGFLPTIVPEATAALDQAAAFILEQTAVVYSP